MILSILALLILIIYFVFFVAQFFNIIFRGYAPFVSTSRRTLRKIIAAVKIISPAVIYELGCGRGRFLRLAVRTWPEAKLIGVENIFSLYLLNKIGLKLQGSRIKLLNKDFFDVNLKDAALIYCYLNGPTMVKLGEKFRRECLSGTQIISRSFSIPQLKIDKMLIIEGKKVYFYKV
jgi:hypothetical protein